MKKTINLEAKNAWSLEGITSMAQLHEGDRLNFSLGYRIILDVNLKRRTIRTVAEMAGESINLIDYQVIGRTAVKICEIHAEAVTNEADSKRYQRYHRKLEALAQR